MDDVFYISDQAQQEFQEWFAALRQLLGILSGYCTSYIDSDENATDTVVLPRVQRISENIQRVNIAINEMESIILPQINRIALVSLLYDVRTPIFSIHVTIEIITSGKLVEIDSTEPHFLQLVRFNTELYDLAREAKPFTLLGK